MSVSIVSLEAKALSDSKGKSQTRLKFHALDGRDTFLIAIRKGGEQHNKSWISNLLSSCLWTPLTTEINGKPERVLVNIQSVAKRFGLSRSEAVKLCRKGELIEWVRENKGTMKKIDSTLPHVKFKMGEARDLIRFLDKKAKKLGEESLVLHHPRTGLNICYTKGRFFIGSLNEEIGKGSYKIAVKAREVNTDEDPNKIFALLIGKKAKNPHYKIEESFLKEFNGESGFLTNLGVIDFGKERLYLQPYYERGNLRDPLLENKLTTQEKDIVAKRMLENLVTLQQHKVVHADIKPENFLITGQGNEIQCVLSDFGLAYHHHEKKTQLRGCTPAYAAPEVLNNWTLKKRDATFAGDTWSMGVVLAELYGHQDLANWAQKTSTLVAKGWSVQLLLRHRIPQDKGRPIRKLISQMLELDPCKRISPQAAVTELERIQSNQKPTF